MNHKNPLRKAATVLFFFFLAATVISGGIVVKDCVERYREEKFWEDIRALKDAGYVAEEGTDTPNILPEYQKLYETNPDMMGWIKIEGAKIDTPVVQTKDDPEYYLRRDFLGEDYSGGTPFIDYRCSVYPRRSFNLILYGHYSDSDKLFRRLLDYAAESFAEKNRYIYFDTLEEKGVYEVVAAFYYNAAGAVLNAPDDNEGENACTYYNYIEHDSPEKFEQFVETIAQQNRYGTDVQLTPEDELLTVTCCAGEAFSPYGDDGRFVVIAKKINQPAL